MDEKPYHNPSKKAKTLKEKPTSIAKVPEPILSDILSLLPIKTIVECYRVCRYFHHITTEDPRFYPLHFSRSPELLICSPNLEKMVLVDLDSFGDTACELNLRLNNMEVMNSLGDTARKLNLRLDNMEVMNSCRGLLCIRPLYSSERIYVLNPFNLEFVVLPNLHHPIMEPRFQLVTKWVGLGYSPKTNEYKVLSIAEYQIISGKIIFVIDIFTLGGTGSWKRIECDKPDLKLTDCFYTSLNGSFHWVMNEYIVNRRYDSLTYFNLEDETFGEISLPAPFELSELSDRERVCVLSLGAFEELLTICVLHVDGITVWGMKEYGNPASWNLRIYLSLQTVMHHFNPKNIRCFIPVKIIYKSELEREIICLLDNVLVTMDHEPNSGPELDYYDTNILKTNKFSQKMPPLSKAFMHIPILMPFKKLIAGVTDVHSLWPTARKVWRRCILSDDDSDDGDSDDDDGDIDDDDVDEWVISTIEEST